MSSDSTHNHPVFKVGESYIITPEIGRKNPADASAAICILALVPGRTAFCRVEGLEDYYIKDVSIINEYCAIQLYPNNHPDAPDKSEYAIGYLLNLRTEFGTKPISHKGDYVRPVLADITLLSGFTVADWKAHQAKREAAQADCAAQSRQLGDRLLEAMAEAVLRAKASDIIDAIQGIVPRYGNIPAPPDWIAKHLGNISEDPALKAALDTYAKDLDRVNAPYVKIMTDSIAKQPPNQEWDQP